MPKIREMLKEILEKKMLNQKELAERLEVSPAQITRWLTDAEPRLSNYQKIEEIYKDLTA